MQLLHTIRDTREATLALLTALQTKITKAEIHLPDADIHSPPWIE